MLTVLESGEALPATNSCRVTTTVDYQTVGLVKVFYGDYHQTEKNTLVDAIRLTGILALKKGKVEIELKLSVDVKGLVTLKSREVTSETKWGDHVFHQRIRKFINTIISCISFLLFAI